MRGGGKSSPNLDPISLLLPSLQTEDPHTINVRLGAHNPTTRDRDLVLPWQIGKFTIVRQVGIHRMELGCCVRDRIRVITRNRTTHHVSRDVATSTAAGNSYRFQPSKNLGELLDSQPVELNSLACGYIAKAMSELIGQCSDFSQLSGIHLTPRYPHSEHEVAVFFRFLLINSVPFKTCKVIRFNGLHAVSRIAG